MKGLSCLVLLGSKGHTKAEGWLHRGQVAATLDLIEQLQTSSLVDEVCLKTPDLTELPADLDNVRIEASSAEDFHFGRELLAWSQGRQGPLAYFGGSSAPLLKGAQLEPLLVRILEAEGPAAITNNRFSSDWLIFNGLHDAAEFFESLETDNPLGWGLQNQLGWWMQDLPATSLSRTDIDTPWDLLMLEGHPELGANLRRWLAQVEPALLSRLGRMRDLLSTPAKTLMVIGRSSSAAWQQLERSTQVWTRLIVEERGMLASGRLRRGEVQSIVAKQIEAMGLVSFLEAVGSMADGLLWDNRVWLASTGGWPEKADRYSADLGWQDEVADPRLSELVAATQAAEIPIIHGGHAVVSGGLMALLESLEGRRG